MADVNPLIQKAIAAYKSKQKSVARELLMQAVDLDEQNEQGWLYLSLVVDSLEEQKICLENVLAINPENAQAKKAMTIVRQKLGEPDTPIVPPPPAPKAPSPDSGWGDIDVEATWSALSGGGASGRNTPIPPPAPSMPAAPASSASSSNSWFDDLPWDSMNHNENDPALSGGVDFSTTDSEAPRAVTSVEWGNSADSGSGYYGSGRQVDTFTNTELDSWISGLPINNAEKKSSEPEDGEEWATPWPVENNFGDGPFDTIAPPKSASPFTTLDLDEPLPQESSKTAPIATPSFPPVSSSSAFPSMRSSNFYDDDSDDDDSDTGTSFFNDSSDDDDDPFFDIDGLDSIGLGDAIKPVIQIPGIEFFSQIPAEIQAPIEKVKQSGGKLGIFILLLLNIAAIVGLAVNLMA